MSERSKRTVTVVCIYLAWFNWLLHPSSINWYICLTERFWRTHSAMKSSDWALHLSTSACSRISNWTNPYRTDSGCSEKINDHFLVVCRFLRPPRMLPSLWSLPIDFPHQEIYFIREIFLNFDNFPKWRFLAFWRRSIYRSACHYVRLSPGRIKKTVTSWWAVLVLVRVHRWWSISWLEVWTATLGFNL